MNSIFVRSSSHLRRPLCLACLATSLAIAAAIATLCPPAARAADPLTAAEALVHATALSTAFRNAAEIATPSVVVVRSVVKPKRADANRGPRARKANPFEGTPFEGMFPDGVPEDFDFNSPDGRMPGRSGVGSGVIVAAEGIVITNNHVIEGADEVVVRLSDGREFKAADIKTDPDSDLAVVRLANAAGLPVAKLGDSDGLSIGDWVIAIGNPFELETTVSAGIISGKHRELGSIRRAQFLQTDAAINPGNSGGPLVNLDGEAVGMNTAIFSRSGGYMGIGFAIPINMARNIYLQLAEHGKVTRGRIGVYIQDLTRELAESFEIDQRQGILVSQVMDGSAAEKGGLKQGDVILKLNGEVVDNVAAFRNQVAMTRPGTTIELEILRQGKVRKHKIVVDAMEVETAASDPAPAAEAGTDALPQLGLRLQKLTPELAEQFGYQQNRGVLVAAVEPDSVAARAGIEAGALIEEVNRVDVNDPKDVAALVEKSQRDTVLLLLRQGSSSRYIALRYK